MKNKLALLLLVFITTSIFSQLNTNRKKVIAVRTTTAPKIDGHINDAPWEKATFFNNFIELSPNNGKSENKNYETEVKLLYDDNALYISAFLKDPNPEKIPMEFSTRDNIGQADLFFVTINPNDDGQNPFEFIVESTGNQADAKVSNGNEDFNWSAVWDSAVKLTDKGWCLEMKIPYGALRFANQEIQSWGFNFHRKIRNLNAQYTWNHIDNTKGIWTQHDGLIENFKNISPPTRLNLYPYASGTTNTFEGKTDFTWSAGLDIKYGLSENFTLDATLIPDFSQTAFDDIELNLSAFEQELTEQRQFFTEGTELFSKGDLFYSRRIGESPIDQFDIGSNLEDNEEITEYPTKVDMLNAVKISGRTKKGLGIGFFNAITKDTKTIIKDTLTTETREVSINPFSNYNILVLDQQFNQNSSLTLINTNVTRNGSFRDANATGLLWHLEDKTSTYNMDGSFKTTYINDDIDKNKPGYAFDTSFGRHSGKWRGEIGYSFLTENYDPNDMGILLSNNEQLIYSWLGYRQLKPKGIFNDYGGDVYCFSNFQHTSVIYTGSDAGVTFWGTTRERFSFGSNIRYRSLFKDFNEPRQGNTEAWFFKRPEKLNIYQWGSSDYRKKLAIDYNWYYTFFNNHPKDGYGFAFQPRYRFNNKFSLTYGLGFDEENNDQGYVDENEDVIIFGQRKTTSYNNTISSKYSFSIKSSLSLTFRHNWSKVLYNDQYYSLKTNGLLNEYDYSGTENVNFNSWNLDLNYIWQIAPGSQLIAFYRNAINPDSDFAPANIKFSDNLDRLFQENVTHTFSLRVVYFLDYNQIKNIF